HDEPPTDTDTYIHRMGRTGRAGRTGMSIVFVGPGKMRRLTPINRHVGELEKYEVPTDLEVEKIQARRVLEEVSATVPGDLAKHLVQEAMRSGLSPMEIAERALESLLEQRPSVDAPEESGEADTVALALKVGSMDRVQPGSIVACLCNTGGLRADDIGRIDILEKMSVVEVPRSESQRLLESLDRAKIAQRFVMPRLAEDWRFKAQPGRGGPAGGSGGYKSGYQGRKDSQARKVQPRRD
ncbi:MAG: DbpA RNA binding domain-containing protein, partial [Thermoplasmatota archaeon]